MKNLNALNLRGNNIRHIRTPITNKLKKNKTLHIWLNDECGTDEIKEKKKLKDAEGTCRLHFVEFEGKKCVMNEMKKILNLDTNPLNVNELMNSLDDIEIIDDKGKNDSGVFTGASSDDNPNKSSGSSAKRIRLDIPETTEQS